MVASPGHPELNVEKNAWSYTVDFCTRKMAITGRARSFLLF